MTTWTDDELTRIAGADELEIAPARGDGTRRAPVPVWVVREGDRLYVRAYRGREGAWFRAARASQEGRVSAGGVDKDVTFVEEGDPAVNDRVDDAYRVKYGHYSGTYLDPMIATTARAATLQLLPR